MYTVTVFLEPEGEVEHTVRSRTDDVVFVDQWVSIIDSDGNHTVYNRDVVHSVDTVIIEEDEPQSYGFTVVS